MTDEEKRSEEEAEAPEADKAEESNSEEKSEEPSAEESSSEEKSEESSDEPEASPKEEPEVAAAVAHEEPLAKASDHGHGDHDDHLGHTAPMSLLIGVLVALAMLTVLTVAVTAVDLGSEGNFIVAMVIATVKAVLVMGYFMHMFWDSKFNVVAFTSSFLFVLLFLAMTLLDRSEYQKDIDKYETDKKAQM